MSEVIGKPYELPTFEFVELTNEDLEHKYPNDDNHPIMGAKQNWEWMKQFMVP